MVKKRSKILILVALILMLSTIFSSLAVQNKKESVKADSSTLITVKQGSGAVFGKYTNKLVQVEHTSYNPSETIYLTFTNSFVTPPTGTLISNGKSISAFVSTYLENDINYMSSYDFRGNLIATSSYNSPLKTRLGAGWKIKLYSSSTDKTDGNLLDEVTFVLLGDCNNDGKVNPTDASLLHDFIFDNTEYNEFQKAALDLNNDGYVDILDFNMLYEGIDNSDVYNVVYQIPPTGVIFDTLTNLIVTAVLSILLVSYLKFLFNKKNSKIN